MTAVVHRVLVAGTGESFACAADDTLLRAAQRAGLGFPYECNVGSCGNCRFELVDGALENAWPEAPALSEKDRARGRHLGCQSMPRGDCTIKLRPQARYAPVQRPQRTGASLLRRRALTHDIEEFVFELDAAQGFEPGQYALVQLPGVAGPRAYSMSNVAGDGRRWEFQVRKLSGGVGSVALFALAPGARVAIDGPYGMAWLRRTSPRDIVCIAGGSGLAPMVSILRGAVAEPQLAGRRLDLVYGGRTVADLCGRDLLMALPGWGERLHYHPVVSAQPAGEPVPAGVETGFAHESAQRRFGERLRECEVYFAGPPAMTEAVQRMLLEAGVPPDQHHFDQFY
ncbi:MAG TPA: 2Fe-2S iron-sulfur cluster-binding protein [Burkholderiaceae bacterium]|nr:2Fe-2S iron-sulfur cluster-binding protein [Burkholderiaceae bacterium]